jgi:hypothetical protein
MQKFINRYPLQLETLAVLLLAGATRLTDLGVFLAIDEEDRWAWAIDFYRALLAGNLPGTLVGDGYPGIFPVWLETGWLFLASLYRSALQGAWLGDEGVYLLLHEWERYSNLALQRFPIALTNTLLVGLIFLYARRLFGRWPALLAAILICLDPFLLSDSRVNRAEGLLTGLMTLSLLAFVAHQRWRSRKHLAASAMFGGLAWLTKSQAIVLLPMFGAIGLIWQLRTAPGYRAALARWFMTMAAWTLGAAAMFVLLWPAAWVIPQQTFSLVFNYATGKVGAEGVKIFFLGQTVLDEDPGLIFYPLNFLLRATPAMLLGLLVGLALLAPRLKTTLSNWRTGPRSLAALLDEAGLWALLAYALLYIGGMSLGSHKQDRFIMAAFPALNILAAAALVALAGRRSRSTRHMGWVAAALLAVQLATALPYHPYYFSYFNPLLGGGPTAQKLVRIGWGEGMDQVADYLQSQEHPEEMLVATRFWRFLLGFKGREVMLDAGGEWVNADKVIFYIQQTQRMLDPSPGVIRYFQQHVPPEKTIVINGIDYAAIYPNPIDYPAHPQIDRIDGQLSLLGYRWDSAPEMDPSKRQALENFHQRTCPFIVGCPPDTTVRLIWENLADALPLPGVRLRQHEFTLKGWEPCQTAADFTAAAQTPGEVVESDCRLNAYSLQPGLYDLQVGVKQPDGEWQPLEFSAGGSVVEVTDTGQLRRVSAEEAFAQQARQQVPPQAVPLERLYAGQVRLLAYQTDPPAPQPGQPLTVTLYWQAQRVLDREANLSVQAFMGDNQPVAAANAAPQLPTPNWRPGEVMIESLTLALPAGLPTPAQLRLDAGLYLPDTLTPLPVTTLSGESIPGAIGYVRITPPDGWPVYHGNQPLLITFGDNARLTGAEIHRTGDKIEATLYWAALAPFPPGEPPYTAFVHLLDAAGQLIAQSDVQPGGGYYPTTAWQPGDAVTSRHTLTLPVDVPPGQYTLRAGLYRPTDFTRLPARDEANRPLPDDAAPIGQIDLP